MTPCRGLLAKTCEVFVVEFVELALNGNDLSSARGIERSIRDRADRLDRTPGGGSD